MLTTVRMLTYPGGLLSSAPYNAFSLGGPHDIVLRDPDIPSIQAQSSTESQNW